MFSVPTVAENYIVWEKGRFFQVRVESKGQIIAQHCISNKKRPNSTIQEVKDIDIYSEPKNTYVAWKDHFCKICLI